MSFFIRDRKRVLLLLLAVFIATILTAKVSPKDSLLLKQTEPVEAFYRAMIRQGPCFFSLTVSEGRLTRCFLDGNSVKREFVLPSTADTVFRNFVLKAGINYDSLIMLVKLMSVHKFCSVGFTGSGRNCSIHIGYKVNRWTGRVYCVVFISDEQERVAAERNKNYVCLRSGVYKTSFIER